MRFFPRLARLELTVLLASFAFLTCQETSSDHTLTDVSRCICSESGSLCMASATAPKGLILHADFDSVSPVDKYSQAWISEHSVRTAFGRKNVGKSVEFSRHSRMSISTLHEFKAQTVSMQMWLRMKTKLPYAFSSILTLDLTRSPFASKEDQSNVLSPGLA